MLWDNLNKALCNIKTSRVVTKGLLKLGNLTTEGCWSLWCEGDLSWKSVAVVLAKMLTGAPEQCPRIKVWKRISLGSIQEKVLPCPAQSCLSSTHGMSREEQTGRRNSSPEREEVSEKRPGACLHQSQGGREVVERGVRICSEMDPRNKQDWLQNHSHCQ